MQDRNFPNTLVEMRRLAEESQRFRTEDVPPRLHEKERVVHAFRDLERHLRDSGESIDRELHPESLERNWKQLMMLYQERDQMIHDEIKRLVFTHSTVHICQSLILSTANFLHNLLNDI